MNTWLVWLVSLLQESADHAVGQAVRTETSNKKAALAAFLLK